MKIDNVKIYDIIKDGEEYNIKMQCIRIIHNG